MGKEVGLRFAGSPCKPTAAVAIAFGSSQSPGYRQRILQVAQVKTKHSDGMHAGGYNEL